ncbi:MULTISPECIES: hypothetical protein [Paenarthrobacter]|jgi:hypothetical protein|uniref:hypothetical protein n=1 Tax=Paenarthrobacter TaxID=1742992 RepID=UPI00222F7142|nr:hypothetical protein [Paenarthrobacter sp. PAE-2]MCW3767246.1 hypothetical protein [Paenarthrobacter sp. PAE-2]
MTANHSSHIHGGRGPLNRTERPAQGLKGRLQGLWHTVTAVLGLVMGLVPHVLHHVGLLTGTALVAGTGGTALFGALGFVASIPMLVRLYRKFGTWVAPALGFVVFAAMFSLSAFVIGPAISGTAGDTNPAPEPTVNHSDHSGH